MSTYARTTSVSITKSKEEIERTLTRFGASHFAYAVGPSRAQIQFVFKEKRILFDLLLPDKNDKRFKFSPNRHIQRTPEAAEKEWEQECRSHWRALALLVKAKLAAVEAGITSFEEEFLAHIVAPNGKTMGQIFIPQLEAAYRDGKIPLLLPPASEP